MSLKYRADIDGIRAIAVSSVVLFHAFPLTFKGGFAGVDVFFVISGFLITSIMLGNFDDSTFSFFTFYSKRIKRIFPSLIFMLVTCLLLAQFIFFSDELNKLTKHIMGGSGFISNFILWNESGYFDTATNTKPLLHLWSLAIEEQYYLFWPLTLVFLRKNKFNLLTFTILIAAISFSLNVKGINKDATATFYSTITRIWEIMFGSILAYLTRTPGILSSHLNSLNYFLDKIIYHDKKTEDYQTLRNVCSIIGFLTVMGSVIFMKERAFPGWKALWPVIGTMLLIAAGSKGIINRLLLSNKVMVWIGLISYPLYLWHWPLISFLYIYLGNTPPFVLKTSAVILSVILAWFSFQFIEYHFKKKTNKQQDIKIVGALCSGLLLLSIISLYQFQKTDAYTDDPFLYKQTYAKSDKCLKKYPFNNNTFCISSNITKSPNVIVLGDSHANHLYAGLKEYYSKKNQEVINFGPGVCLPFYNLNSINNGMNCASSINPAIDEAISNTEVKTVILSSFYSLYTKGDIIFETVSNPALKDRKEILKLAIFETVEKLTKANKEVILFYDVPEIEVDPRNCQMRTISWSEENKRILTGNCKSNLAYSKNEIELIYEEIAHSTRINKNLVKFFNPREFMCYGNECSIIKNNFILYRDTNHLNQLGSKWLASTYNF